MRRIKIKDLPKDANITKEEMRRVLGGIIDDGRFLQNLSQDKIDYKIEPSILFKL
ncbi:MAG: hypothetical protein ACUVXD_12885 [Thermodesulfobacteriota bacterium]